MNFCEFDRFAEQSYCAVHDVDPKLNLGDITKIDETMLKPFNMITGGSPCFPAGTLIATDHGNRPIEEIKVGDKVYTHKHRFCEVAKTGCTKQRELYTLDASLVKITGTANHPIFIKETETSEPRFCPLSECKPLWFVATVEEYWPTHIRNKSDVNTMGYVWVEIRSVSPAHKVADVYNMEVKHDHTYIANGIVVHNCQDFSVAGKQAGSMWKCTDCGAEYNPLTVHYSVRHKCPKCGSESIDKTRSSLLVEWLRIIRANKPKWGIYENVKNIVGKKFKDTFDMFINELHAYGYNTYYKVLNAKDYGIPQNRERVYLIIILKEYDNGLFEWPEPFDNGLRLNDMLDDEVDESYYVNTERAKQLVDELISSGKLEKSVSNAVRGGGHGSLDRHQWDAVMRPE